MLDNILSKDSSRRNFLINAGQVALSLMIAGTTSSYANQPSGTDKLGKTLPRRRLGKTGLMPTIYCTGGFHVGAQSEKVAQGIIEAAISNGVRFFDTANQYQNGKSEEYYGKFLTPEYREFINIMSKSAAKDAATMRKHLEQSFRSMKTDHIDLYMIHTITSPEDVDNRLDNGVLDVLREYKAKGRIGHIGFSGHNNFEAHQYLLKKNIADIEACLMPINVADPSYRSFIINTMESMVEKDIGILAMKSLCMGGLFGRRGGSDRQSKVVLPTVIPNKISIAQAHAFALSMPIGSLVSGVDTPQQLHDNLKSIWDYKALTKEEQDELIALCRPEALTGKMEFFKGIPKKSEG